MSLRHSIASLTRAVNPLLAARWTTASSSLVGWGPISTLLAPSGSFHILPPRTVPQCARVSYRAFTAETSESLSDLPEPETVGWGATKMSDMLQEKVGVCFSMFWMVVLLAKPSDLAPRDLAPKPFVQGPEAGAWLWVSRDDHVIDAVRKVRCSR